MNLDLIYKNSHNTRTEKEEKEEERKSRRAVARAATHNFMQVLYLCFLFFVCVFALFSKSLACKVFFAGLEEQYERCERQSYQVTEVNLKLFLADFQGLRQVGHKICNFFFTQKNHYPY